MQNLLHYILSEVKNKRLNKADALSLIQNFKAQMGRGSQIHPLLHQNTSNLSEQKFSSVFTGQEFFLNDHKVKGQRVLPGVAYLEMARAAFERATVETQATGMRLKDVVWTRPFIFEKQNKIHVRLFPNSETDGIDFEIFGEENNVVHSQGSIDLLADRGDSETEKLDLDAIGKGLKPLPVSRCYEVFDAMGINYGPGHRGLSDIHVGPDRVVAKLTLPSSISNTIDQYVLHPCLMDSALQGAIALLMGQIDMADASTFKPVMPFAMGSLEVFASCTSTMWAVIGYSEGYGADDSILKLDIRLYNGHGQLCVLMKGYTSRELEAPEDAVVKSMLTRVWDVVDVDTTPTEAFSKGNVAIIGATKAHAKALSAVVPNAKGLPIRSGDSVAQIEAKLKKHGEINHLIWIAPVGDGPLPAIIEDQNEGVLFCFRIIKALLGAGLWVKGFRF